MTHARRRATDVDDAAQILRGYKKRIEQLEEKDRGGDRTVQLFRGVADTVNCSDSVTTTENAAASFRFGVDEWGFAEFGGN